LRRLRVISKAIGVQRLVAQGLLIEVRPRYPTEPMPVFLLYADRRNLSESAVVYELVGGATETPHLD
jgi:hypothetical protein